MKVLEIKTIHYNGLSDSQANKLKILYGCDFVYQLPMYALKPDTEYPILTVKEFPDIDVDSVRHILFPAETPITKEYVISRGLDAKSFENGRLVVSKTSNHDESGLWNVWRWPDISTRIAWVRTTQELETLIDLVQKRVEVHEIQVPEVNQRKWWEIWK